MQRRAVITDTSTAMHIDKGVLSVFPRMMLTYQIIGLIVRKPDRECLSLEILLQWSCWSECNGQAGSAGNSSRSLTSGRLAGDFWWNYSFNCLVSINEIWAAHYICVELSTACFGDKSGPHFACDAIVCHCWQRNLADFPRNFTLVHQLSSEWSVWTTW